LRRDPKKKERNGWNLLLQLLDFSMIAEEQKKSKTNESLWLINSGLFLTGFSRRHSLVDLKIIKQFFLARQGQGWRWSASPVKSILNIDLPYLAFNSKKKKLYLGLRYCFARTR
jgi:hypothetical protein